MPRRSSIFAFLCLSFFVSTEGTQDCTALETIGNCLSCGQNNSVHCAKLGRIPDELRKYQRVNITGDDMTILPRMGEFANLTHLALNYVGIRLVTDGAFSNLTRLKDLSLAHNHITDLGSETFEGLDDLEILDLSSNKIYLVDSPIFDVGKLPKLRHLKLGQNNIVQVERNSFKGHASLITLDLSMNRIETMENFATLSAPLSSLKVLDLGHNRILKIPQDFFVVMPALEGLILRHNFLVTVSQLDFEHLGSHLLLLDLQGNRISEVQSKCFKDLERVMSLDLSHNLLRELRDKALPESFEERGGELMVYGNPINCSNCDNAWMAKSQMMKDANHANEKMCSDPLNTTFGEAADSLFTQCRHSPDSSMKSASLVVFFLVVLSLVFLIFLYGMYHLRKKRRSTTTLNLGQRPGGSSPPPDKGVFSYRGLKEEFPFSIDEADENRL